MQPDRPEPDDDLHGHERLRVSLAIGALLLGLLDALHP